MTFDEVKELLMSLKRAQTYAHGIQQNINSLSFYQSSLGKPETGGKGLDSSPVEKMVMRIEEARERLTQALEKAFEIEDKLFAALDTLEPSERHIIEGSYLRSQTHWQLANEMGYCERQIIRIKNNAIKKMSPHVTF